MTRGGTFRSVGERQEWKRCLRCESVSMRAQWPSPWSATPSYRASTSSGSHNRRRRRRVTGPLGAAGAAAGAHSLSTRSLTASRAHVRNRANYLRFSGRPLLRPTRPRRHTIRKAVPVVAAVAVGAAVGQAAGARPSNLGGRLCPLLLPAAARLRARYGGRFPHCTVRRWRRFGHRAGLRRRLRAL